tara:strand:+ start:21526 stop:22431 length:906 start_codon:yes stop_codon:yes gene_type:complete
MSYFSHLPNVYVGKGITDDDAFTHDLVKNIFRRVIIREDIDQYVTQFELKTLPDGIRPEQVAEAVCGSAYMDWLILLVNNITDIYEQWPRRESDLQNYVNEKYDNDPDDLHHWETREAIWEQAGFEDITVIEKGHEVNETFRAVMPDGTTRTKEQSIYPVSNYEHESHLNDKKRFIRIPTQGLINKIESEIDELLAYEDHRELNDENDKFTPLSVAQRFLNTKGYVSGSETISLSQLGTIVSYDNGPGSSTIKIGDESTTTTSTSTTETTTTSSSTTTTTTTTTTTRIQTFDGGDAATASY